MTPLWIFHQRISSYFRTLTGNIFLGVCFVEARKSRLQACSIREETVLQRSFGIFEILKHPPENNLSLLRTSRKAFVMEVLVQWQAVDCSHATSLNGNCICFPGYFPKFLVQLFQNIVMKSSATKFNRVLGCRLQSYVSIKSHSTSDNFFKTMEITLFSQKAQNGFLFWQQPTIFPRIDLSIDVAYQYKRIKTLNRFLSLLSYLITIQNSFLLTKTWHL